VPYLMLNFRQTQEEEDYLLRGDGDDRIRRRPTGRSEIEMTLIDTQFGKVVELKIDGTVEQVERAPQWGETDAAAKVLNRDTNDAIQLDRMKAEVATYREKVLSADRKIKESDRLVIEYRNQIKDLQGRVLDDDEGAFVAHALEDFIAKLGLNGSYDDFLKAKKLFRRLAGISWNSEDDDDEEEEESPVEPEQNQVETISKRIELLEDQEFGFKQISKSFTWKWEDVTSYRTVVSGNSEMSVLDGFHSGRKSGKTLMSWQAIKDVQDKYGLVIEDSKRATKNVKKLGEALDDSQHECPLCGKPSKIHIPKHLVNRQMRRAQKKHSR
jgi:hypothetical protein